MKKVLLLVWVAVLASGCLKTEESEGIKTSSQDYISLDPNRVSYKDAVKMVENLLTELDGEKMRSGGAKSCCR